MYAPRLAESGTLVTDVCRQMVISLHRGATPVPTAAHQYWAMDFVYDQLVSGRPFRVLTVIDR
jgi:hypothetical protein